MNMQLRYHTIVQSSSGDNLPTPKQLKSTWAIFTGEELTVVYISILHY